MPKQGNLKFTKYKVHLIYGFITKPQKRRNESGNFDTWFTEKQSNGSPKMRSGWTPMYRLKNDPTTVIQYVLRDGHSKYKVLGPKMWNPESDETHDNTLEEYNVSLSTWVTLRRDGVGAMTLSFEVDYKSPIQPYGMDSLLAMLLLAPRTLYGIRASTTSPRFGPETELAHLDPMPVLPAPDEVATESARKILASVQNSWGSFSCAFKTFLCEMIAFLEDAEDQIEWCEFGDTDTDVATLYGEDSYESDPQVPYMYVFADAPFSIYQEAFLEEGTDADVKRKARAQYTKDIAAILGRWLIEENISYASTDYWEARGLIREGTFRSLYMNSLVFTTFSGMVTFSLRPDLSDVKRHMPDLTQVELQAMRLPFEPTSQSILRCLEFSRLRWHHVLWLNRELDHLIQQVVTDADTGSILPRLRVVVKLRSQAAIYLEDPLAYLWDATVGSELARFLHVSVIEDLEKSTLRKLEMVKQLISDRLDIVKTDEFIKAMMQTT